MTPESGCGADGQQPRGLTASEAPGGRAKRLDSRRVYVALVFIPLFYVLVRYLPPLVFFVFILTVTLITLFEFYRLYFRDRRALWAIGIGLTAAIALLVSLQWPGLVSERIIWLLTLAAALGSRLVCTRALAQSLTDAAVVVFGVVYIGLTFGHILLTRALPEGEFLIFFVVLVTWAGDTGAYYTGMLLGRRPLAPQISPNKTIEGLIGGLLLATGAALLARVWFLQSFSIGDSLACGLLLAGAGVLGDLSESVLKRSAGVKDSGTLIPAHGGMLDRVDSMLFTIPTFYYYVTLVKT